MTNRSAYLSYFRPIVGAMILALVDSDTLPTQSRICKMYVSINNLTETEIQLLVRANGQSPFDQEDLR
jgi:hypothetical protein